MLSGRMFVGALVALIAWPYVCSANGDGGVVKELGLEVGPPQHAVAEADYAKFERDVMAPFLASRSWGDSRVIQGKSERPNNVRVVNTYDISNWHDPAWDDDAETFMRRWGQRQCKMPGAPSEVELSDEAWDIYQAGCREPMFLYALGWSLDVQRKYRSTESLFIQSDSAMFQTEYPSYRQYTVKNRYAKTLRRTKRGDGPDSARTWAWHKLIEAIDAGEFNGTRLQRKLVECASDCVADEVSLNVADEFLKEFRKREGKGVDACTLQTVLGGYHVRRAREYRGSGLAITVTEEGWKGFKQQMEIAGKHLAAAHKNDPTRPEAAAIMITLCGTGHAPAGTDLSFWLEQMMAAEIDNRLGFGQALWYLNPRWGGSHEATLDLAAFCVALDRPDTELPLVFIDGVRQIFVDTLFPGRAVLESPEVYDLLVEVIEETAAHPNHSYRANWLRSVRVAIAYQSGRLDDARAAAIALGDDVEVLGLNYFGTNEEDIDRLRTAVTTAQGANNRVPND